MAHYTDDEAGISALARDLVALMDGAEAALGRTLAVDVAGRVAAGAHAAWRKGGAVVDPDATLDVGEAEDTGDTLRDATLPFGWQEDVRAAIAATPDGRAVMLDDDTL